jgi:uncharacterized membrane protein
LGFELGENFFRAKIIHYIPLIVAVWDAGYDAVLRGAAAMVVASTTKEADNGMVDLTLALSYLELAALTMGIGTCCEQLNMSGIKNVFSSCASTLR